MAMLNEKKDEAITISNPRLLSAAYFALLAIIVTIAIDLTLYALGIEQIVPLFKAILIAVVLASSFGALFGERIVHCKSPYRKTSFLWGFTMVIAAIPFYALIFFYLYSQDHHAIVEKANPLIMYCFILLYSFLFAGLWLAIAAGFAAMYLRGHIVYDILHSQYDRRQKNHPPSDVDRKNNY